MNKLGRNTLGVGLATLLVTSAVSFSASAEEGDLSQSTAIAAQADEGLFSILNTGPECVASFNEGDEPIGDGEGEGRCVLGFDFSGVGLIDQNATAGVEDENGVSRADASVAPIAVDGLGSIDVTTLDNALADINTGTILDTVLGPLGGALDLILAPVLDALGEALNPVLDGVGDALPISLEIGAVESFCEASPGQATGNGTVASVDVVVLLGDQRIVLPMELGTDPNTDLVAGSPQPLVNGLLDGIRASLNESIGGALAPVADLVGTLQEDLVNAILDAVGPALLEPLSEALQDLVTGTVNEQTSTGEGHIEVTALDLTALDQQLELAKVSCGPNRLAVADDADADAQADDADAQADDADADADADDADAQADAIADADADAQADAIADADAQADADVTTALPNAGAPNLLPFWLLGAGLVLFGAAVLANERRRALLS